MWTVCHRVVDVVSKHLVLFIIYCILRFTTDQRGNYRPVTQIYRLSTQTYRLGLLSNSATDVTGVGGAARESVAVQDGGGMPCPAVGDGPLGSEGAATVAGTPRVQVSPTSPSGPEEERRGGNGVGMGYDHWNSGRGWFSLVGRQR